MPLETRILSTGARLPPLAPLRSQARRGAKVIYVDNFFTGAKRNIDHARLPFEGLQSDTAGSMTVSRSLPWFARNQS